jgi:hypothetical protein
MKVLLSFHYVHVIIRRVWKGEKRMWELDWKGWKKNCCNDTLGVFSHYIHQHKSAPIILFTISGQME